MRIREDADVIERMVGDEGRQLGDVGVLLAWETDDECGAEGDAWDAVADGPWAYRVEPVDVVPDVPLSLGSSPEVLTTTVSPGTRVLLHTDGLSEARRGGDFYDVPGATAQFLTGPDVRSALRRVEADVRRWSDRHAWDDLAMLALFGCPQLQRVLDSYAEAHPLADGWRERVALHQLFPLLVHACLFGSGYGIRAGEAARGLL